jgi:plastocyanin
VRTDGERAPADLNPAPWRRAPAVREPHAESVTASADPAIVDVLLVYTSHLHSLLAEPLIRATANAAIEEANLAYERSGISHRIRLAGLEETTYDESLAVAGNNAWDAARLRMVDGADGFMDEIHARRDALHADAVVLLITRNDACGYAELMTAPPSIDFAPQAYAVVSISCAAKSLALAHELGHLMGLEHEREARTLPFEPAFPYAFGYRHPQDKFRTIMATELFCAQRCPRVNYFSNPEKSSDEGLPLGISEAANNALALAQTMPIMAAFRSAAVPAMLVRSFATDRTEIERGQSVTLSWNTENATSVEIGGFGTVAAIGSMTVTPQQSTTYTLTATQPGVAAITSTVHVVVHCDGEPCAVTRRRAARH